MAGQTNLFDCLIELCAFAQACQCDQSTKHDALEACILRINFILCKALATPHTTSLSVQHWAVNDSKASPSDETQAPSVPPYAISGDRDPCDPD